MMSLKKTVTFTYTTTALVNVGLALEMLVRLQWEQVKGRHMWTGTANANLILQEHAV